mgnify:CR=1 FL=1
MIRECDTILIIDFGSQYTQLIARRIRENNIFSLVKPHTLTLKEFNEIKPKGVILSGGPDSVTNLKKIKMLIDIRKLSIPILGICYGMQYIADIYGGKVSKSKKKEFGHSIFMAKKVSKIFPKKIINKNIEESIWDDFVIHNPYGSTQDWIRQLEGGNKQGIIGVEEVSKMHHKMHLKSLRGGNKVMVLFGAEKLTEYASNKLLKLFEEPPKNSFFLLVCDQTDGMLSTLVSRCQRMKLNPLTQDELAKFVQVGTQVCSCSHAEKENISRIFNCTGNILRRHWTNIFS